MWKWITILAAVMLASLAALAAWTPDAAEQVVSATDRGRLVFLVGYIDQVEATTATAAVKWAAVKSMAGALATERDLRAVFGGLSAAERQAARAALIEMKTALFDARRAELTRQENEVTSGL